MLTNPVLEKTVASPRTASSPAETRDGVATDPVSLRDQCLTLRTWTRGIGNTQFADRQLHGPREHPRRPAAVDKHPSALPRAEGRGGDNSSTDWPMAGDKNAIVAVPAISASLWGIWTL